jgi:hypothetical protein
LQKNFPSAKVTLTSGSNELKKVFISPSKPLKTDKTMISAEVIIVKIATDKIEIRLTRLVVFLAKR